MIQVYLVLISCLFYLWVLVLNRSGHFDFSRLAICIFVPTATMLVTVLGKIDNEQVEEFSYLSSRLVLLVTILLPLVLFRLQERNKLIAGLSVNFFFLLFHTTSFSFCVQVFNFNTL
ncbi:hypothetical protein D770_15470 [Flammeovirgaceae bacterium 311]|nr:hypothetical protein D770_15470 [Flammeovirgaceae bacterium 311]